MQTRLSGQARANFWWCLGLCVVLAGSGGCSDDSVSGPAAAGVGTGSPDDASVSDSRVEDAALTDLGVIADAGTDMSEDVGLPAWLTGTWLECTGTLVVTPERTWTWTSASGCVHAGDVAWAPVAGTLAFPEGPTPTCADSTPTWLKVKSTPA